MGKISFYKRLNNLEKTNNGLKSILLHEQLKHGNYSYKHLEDKILLILNEYKINNSIVKSANIVGIKPNIALKWFFEGQMGNANFKLFSDGIKRINNLDADETIKAKIIEQSEDNSYELEQFDNSWVYTAYVGGEKVSIISSDLNHLKEKVLNRNLPPIK